jgi:hypothetical protein
MAARMYVHQSWSGSTTRRIGNSVSDSLRLIPAMGMAEFDLA